MTRSCKKPEERRNEFITTSEELFTEKGFTATSVDDIVDRMHVAKGLFYYYFDSKEDVLKAIIDRQQDELRARANAMMDRDDLTALERLQELSKPANEKRLRSSDLFAFIHQEQNLALHYSIQKRAREFMNPILERIIRQGNQEGVFDAPYPQETALALSAMFTELSHDPSIISDSEAMVRRQMVVLSLGERLLGARPGTLIMNYGPGPRDLLNPRSH